VNEIEFCFVKFSINQETKYFLGSSRSMYTSMKNKLPRLIINQINVKGLKKKKKVKGPKCRKILRRKKILF